MSGYILGLDIGSNSVGWTIIWEGKRSGGGDRIGAGVRVFQEGVAQMNTGKEQPRGQQRREARSARRVHQRRSGRQRKLLAILRAHALLPNDAEILSRLLAGDPYPLRAKALDEALEPFQLGRALFHLCQRRGFRSNRKAPGESDGKIKKDTDTLQEEIEQANCRTLGEYLWGLGRDARWGERVRNRYTLRTMYEQEFEAIWQSQRRFHPHLLSDEAHDAAKEAIFFQRPVTWDASTIGECELEPGEPRCARAHWYGQQFRMLQEIAHLRVIDPLGEERPLTDDERAKLTSALGAKNEMKFDKIKDLLGFTESYAFGLVESSFGKREKLLGNQVEWALRAKLGKWYASAPQATKEAMWDALAGVEDEHELRRLAEDDWRLSGAQADKVLKISLPSGRFNLSVKAIRKMIPYLEAGKVYSEAKELAGYKLDKDVVVLGKLPPLDAWGGVLTNPIVRRAMREVRKVVNALIREYGLPAAVHVELARNAKESTARRREIHFENLKRAKENEEIRERITREFNILSPSRDDVVKYRLWEECDHECPYTGKPIPKHKLFHTSEVEVEHIIPYGRCLDDSYMNKTLCDQAENRIKGDRTPFEAYGEDEPKYEAVLQRAAKLPWPKRRRFSLKHIELDDFVQRQLNDTRYISRLVTQYLRQLGCDVVCTRGQMTAELRRQWGLNNLLDETGPNVKTRDDHRHHAVDAAVVALTSRSRLQRLAHIKFDPRRPQLDPPWETFRDDLKRAVEKINVSHRPTRRLAGALHEESSYGPTDKPDTYVYRKRIEDLTPSMIDDIRDPAIKRIVKEACESRGSVGKALLDPPVTMPSGVPIKRVRVLHRSSTMIPLRKDGERVTKFVAPGDNHHVEVFETIDKKARTVWTGRAVSRFKAHRRLRHGEPVVDRSGGERETFLMTLCNNDSVLLTVNDNTSLYRVEVISVVGNSPDLTFRLHTSANREDKTTKVRFRSWGKFAAARPKKVTVDVLGRIHPCND